MSWVIAQMAQPDEQILEHMVRATIIIINLQLSSSSFVIIIKSFPLISKSAVTLTEYFIIFGFTC